MRSAWGEDSIKAYLPKFCVEKHLADVLRNEDNFSYCKMRKKKKLLTGVTRAFAASQNITLSDT